MVNLAWRKNKAQNAVAENPTNENKQMVSVLQESYDKYIKRNREALYVTDEKGVESVRGNAFNTTFANYIPQFVEQAKGQIGAHLAGAAFGAVSGTGVVGYKIVAKTLGNLSMASLSYANMRGASYEGLLEAGISEERANAASKDEALASSIVEMVSFSVVGELIGFNKLMGVITNVGVPAAADLIAKTGMQKPFMNAAGKALVTLGKYGITVASEAAEEFTQARIGQNVMKQALEKEGLERTTTDEEDLAQALEEGKGGAKVSAIMSALGLAGTSTATSVLQSKVKNTCNSFGKNACNTYRCKNACGGTDANSCTSTCSREACTSSCKGGNDGCRTNGSCVERRRDNY